MYDGSLAVFNDTAKGIGRNTTHRVMCRRQHRDGTVGRINTQIGLTKTCNVRQFRSKDLLAQMGRIQVDVIINFAVAPDAFTGPDFR